MKLRWAVAICLLFLPTGSGCAPQCDAISAARLADALTPPAAEVLRVQAAKICHPLLQPVTIDWSAGLTPDQAAVVAVLANPSLRAQRDRRGLAAAQVIQAGILPNPTLPISNDFPFAGPDHLIAYSFEIAWQFSSLITREAKLCAARQAAASVDLDVAWQEWLVAQSAKSAAYRQLSLKEQLELAQEADRLLREDLATIQKAVRLQLKTEIDLSAAQTASQEAHSTVLTVQRDLAKQQLMLKRLLGLPDSAVVPLRNADLPARLDPPSPGQLQAGVEDRRLDLLALRRGYDSQEASVRAAVLGRFPKVEAGFHTARDTTGTYTNGYTITPELPIFDRNQGNIAIERATRQKLFDEFVSRVFEARSDIATAVAEIRSLNRQISSAEAALPPLSRLVEDYAQALAAGNADVISYYLAYNELEKRRIELLRFKLDLTDAWISLENAAGSPLPPTAPEATSQPTTMPTSAPQAGGTQ